MNLFDKVNPLFHIDKWNDSNFKRNFKVLIDNSIIERIGSDKTGYWQILK